MRETFGITLSEDKEFPSWKRPASFEGQAGAFIQWQFYPANTEYNHSDKGYIDVWFGEWAIPEGGRTSEKRGNIELTERQAKNLRDALIKAFPLE